MALRWRTDGGMKSSVLDTSEGSGHCLRCTELDESPVRVEGTNKSKL